MINAFDNQLMDIPPEVANRFGHYQFGWQSYTRYIKTAYLNHAYSFSPLPIDLQAPYFRDWSNQPVSIQYSLEKPSGQVANLDNGSSIMQGDTFTLAAEQLDELGEYIFHGFIDVSGYGVPNEYRQIFSVEILVERTISFNSGPGATPVDPQTVAQGTPAREPFPPVRPGYTFKGWFSSQSKAEDWQNNITWDSTTPIQNDTTQYAAWSQALENSFNVTFVFRNGSPDKIIDITEGSFIPVISTPIRNGYQFEHWTNNGTIWDFVTMKMPAQNIILVAN